MFVSVERLSHVPLEVQQPVHDVPPQEQAPLEHVCAEPHVPQAAPPVPHSELVWEAYGTHVFPLQQPFGQELALHTHRPLPVLQVCPVEHVAQVAPPVPHEPNDSDAYASQVPVGPPLQQPFAHVVPSQEQTPLVVSQRPLVQAAHAAPPAPHWLADCEA